MEEERRDYKNMGEKKREKKKNEKRGKEETIQIYFFQEIIKKRDYIL